MPFHFFVWQLYKCKLLRRIGQYWLRNLPKIPGVLYIQHRFLHLQRTVPPSWSTGSTILKWQSCKILKKSWFFFKFYRTGYIMLSITIRELFASEIRVRGYLTLYLINNLMTMLVYILEFIFIEGPGSAVWIMLQYPCCHGVACHVSLMISRCIGWWVGAGGSS